MKSDTILDAIGMINDDTIIDAKRSRRPVMSRRTRHAAAAACLVVCVLSVVLLLQNRWNNQPRLQPSGDAQQTSPFQPPGDALPSADSQQPSMGSLQPSTDSHQSPHQPSIDPQPQSPSQPSAQPTFEPQYLTNEQALVEYITGLDDGADSYYRPANIPSGVELISLSGSHSYIDWWSKIPEVSEQTRFIYLRWFFLGSGQEWLDNELLGNGAGRTELRVGETTYYYMLVNEPDAGWPKFYDIMWLLDGYLFNMNIPEESVSVNGKLMESLLKSLTEISKISTVESPKPNDDIVIGSVYIDEIKPYEAMCIARVYIDNSKKYNIDVTTATGDAVITALRDKDNIVSMKSRGVWYCYNESWGMPYRNRIPSVTLEEGEYYLYVGCGSNGNALTGVTVSISSPDEGAAIELLK